MDWDVGRASEGEEQDGSRGAIGNPEPRDTSEQRKHDILRQRVAVLDLRPFAFGRERPVRRGSAEGGVTARIGCALLAAGASRRLGSPKQLWLHDGVPLVFSMTGIANSPIISTSLPPTGNGNCHTNE